FGTSRLNSPVSFVVVRHSPPAPRAITVTPGRIPSLWSAMTPAILRLVCIEKAVAAKIAMSRVARIVLCQLGLDMLSSVTTDFFTTTLCRRPTQLRREACGWMGVLPSSAEEGWLRGKEKVCEATLACADGVVLVKRMIFLGRAV